MLTAEQVERYRWDGYLFPLPALSAGELEECSDGLARLEDWLGSPLTEADRKWRSAGYAFLPWVDGLARHPRVLDAVESVIGPDILVYTSTFFIKEARSPTFAAWHQDATYFGLDPYEHVTAWVALTEAGAEAGCMEVVSSKGRPRQLHHAALGLEHSINGGGQAIVEPFDQDGAVAMALRAGEFSLHHTLVPPPLGAEPRSSIAVSGSGSAISRRMCRTVGSCRLYAMLVRGHDTGGHFDLLPSPEAEFDPAALERHEHVYQRYRAELRRADGTARPPFRRRVASYDQRCGSSAETRSVRSKPRYRNSHCYLRTWPVEAISAAANSSVRDCFVAALLQ